MAFDPLASIRKRTARHLSFPHIATHGGATFVLDPCNWIDNRLAAGVPFEVEQLALAQWTIRQSKLDTFIDIGANIGLYTVMLGRLQEIEQVIAFEPVRRNFNQLLANVFANKLDAKVDAHRIALSDHSGQATIHIDPRSTGVSRLDLEHCGRDRSVYSLQETIDLSRLDDACSLRGRRIYVKIDVEGHTREVLAGMAELFAHNVVYGQIEVTQEDLPDIERMLCQHGLKHTQSIQGDYFFEPK